jgi:hypothetical protein
VAVASLPFDRVVIAEDGDRLDYSTSQFLATPIHRRIRWLLESRLTFFWRSRPVDKRDALMALRRYETGQLREQGKP